ncbi:hypothetical protein [Oxalobacter paraformigenes]|uniref:hypothetical protein n=1 Tax=Oxalobacter paraformigenes TaxID=556268 RepID=UPI0011CC426B|nr:hypothetical protein [Oxalobacter paraformigenes]
MKILSPPFFETNAPLRFNVELNAAILFSPERMREGSGIRFKTTPVHRQESFLYLFVQLFFIALFSRR